MQTASDGSADAGTPTPRHILRFRRTERHVHWAIAAPFLVCWTTAVVLVLVYNPDPQRPFRDVFSWIHRISGICLIVFPAVAVARTAGDVRVHFNNILQAWSWTLADLKWLALSGLAAVNRRIELPEQGKFNAAEKLNFMTLLGTYPLYIVTGLVVWLTDGAFVSWLVHFAMAAVATPLILGHMFMATVNPGTRAGMSGMISGFVDRRWARHHYGRWYRENFGPEEDAARPGAVVASPPDDEIVPGAPAAAAPVAAEPPSPEPAFVAGREGGS